jgi:hypothetical protein
MAKLLSRRLLLSMKTMKKPTEIRLVWNPRTEETSVVINTKHDKKTSMSPGGHTTISEILNFMASNHSDKLEASSSSSVPPSADPEPLGGFLAKQLCQSSHKASFGPVMSTSRGANMPRPLFRSSLQSRSNCTFKVSRVHKLIKLGLRGFNGGN